MNLITLTTTKLGPWKANTNVENLLTPMLKMIANQIHAMPVNLTMLIHLIRNYNLKLQMITLILMKKMISNSFLWKIIRPLLQVAKTWVIIPSFLISRTHEMIGQSEQGGVQGSNGLASASSPLFTNIEGRMLMHVGCKGNWDRRRHMPEATQFHAWGLQIYLGWLWIQSGLSHHSDRRDCVCVI